MRNLCHADRRLHTCSEPARATQEGSASCSHGPGTESWWAGQWCQERRGPARTWNGTVAEGDSHSSPSKSQGKRWASKRAKWSGAVPGDWAARDDRHAPAQERLQRKLQFYFGTTAAKVLAETLTCSSNLTICPYVNIVKILKSKATPPHSAQMQHRCLLLWSWVQTFLSRYRGLPVMHSQSQTYSSLELQEAPPWAHLGMSSTQTPKMNYTDAALIIKTFGAGAGSPSTCFPESLMKRR